MIKPNFFLILQTVLALNIVLTASACTNLDEEIFGEITSENLLAERGREMFVECHRRSDLIRFGVFGEPWWEKPASSKDKELFPIPYLQIQGNPNLTQNPGY